MNAWNTWLSVRIWAGEMTVSPRGISEDTAKDKNDSGQKNWGWSRTYWRAAMHRTGVRKHLLQGKHNHTLVSRHRLLEPRFHLKSKEQTKFATCNRKKESSCDHKWLFSCGTYHGNEICLERFDFFICCGHLLIGDCHRVHLFVNGWNTKCEIRQKWKTRNGWFARDASQSTFCLGSGLAALVQKGRSTRIFTLCCLLWSCHWKENFTCF